MARTIFASDTTFHRFRDAALLAKAKSVGDIDIEVVCGHWRVIVRGAVGATTPRRWFALEVEWEDVQIEDDNPLIDLVEKVAAELAKGVVPPPKKRKVHRDVFAGAKR